MRASSLLFFLFLFVQITAIHTYAASVEFVNLNPPRTVQVDLADTPSKAERGLMFRNSLPEGSGMWFIFPDDLERVFWMKNVGFSLDIVFIDKNYVIKKIERMVPPCVKEPCPRYYSNAPVRYVLEVPGGYCGKMGVKEGQKVEYKP
jgi:hypothetical protein